MRKIEELKSGLAKLVDEKVASSKDYWKAEIDALKNVVVDSMKTSQREAEKLDGVGRDLGRLRAKVYSHYGESVNQPVVALPSRKSAEIPIDVKRIDFLENEMKDLRSAARNLSTDVSALRLASSTAGRPSEALLGLSTVVAQLNGQVGELRTAKEKIDQKLELLSRQSTVFCRSCANQSVTNEDGKLFSKWNNASYQQLKTQMKKNTAAIEQLRAFTKTKVEENLRDDVRRIAADHANLMKRVVESGRKEVQNTQQQQRRQQQPLGSTIQELLKMVEALAKDVNELRQRTFEAKNTERRIDAKVTAVDKEQQNAKSNLVQALNKFNGDIQRIIQQMFHFRDGLEAAKAADGKTRYDLTQITEVLQSLVTENEALKKRGIWLSDFDRRLRGLKERVGLVESVANKLKADTEEIVKLNRQRPILGTISEMIGVVNQLGHDVDRLRANVTRVQRHDDNINKLRGKVSEIDGRLAEARQRQAKKGESRQ